MKKTLLLFLITCCCSSYIISQSFSWLQTADLSYEFNPGMIHYTTGANPDGGAYFFGIEEHISFYNESMGSLFLKKYTSEGDVAWTRTIEGESAVSGAKCDSDGNVYIFGQMLTNTDFWGEGSLEHIGIGTDAFLARVSGDGDLLWCLNLSTLPMGEGTISQIDFDLQGNIGVAYWTWSNSYILFFDPEGNDLEPILQENVNLVSGLDIDEEGNIYAAGSCAGFNSMFAGESYPAPFSYTTYLVKYDVSRQLSWVKFIEDVTCNFPMAKSDGAGGVYFAGPLMTPTLFDSIATDGPAWVYDFFLTRLNAEGEYQWVAECPQVMTGDATVGSLHFLDTDAENNALLAGTTRGVVDWGNGIVSDVTGNYEDILVWSYSPEGVINWVNTAGGAGYEQAHSISAGDDGEAYLAGVILGSGAFDSISYDTEGALRPFLTMMNTEIETGFDEPDHFDEIEIYPIPAKDRIFVQSGIVLSKYRVYNIQGQQVMSDKILRGEVIINIHALPAGYYIFKFETEDFKLIEVPVILQ